MEFSLPRLNLLFQFVGMWLVKKAVAKVAKISENVLQKQSESQKAINLIVTNKEQILPVAQMSQLGTMTYDMYHFQKAVEFFRGKLNDIKLERKSLKKRLNLLILMSYLLKHGPSGFIDEFRTMIPLFTKYETLAFTGNQEDTAMQRFLQEVSQRASYLKTLLNDKSVLSQEKELARRIREKLMNQGGDYSQMSKKSLERGEAESVKEEKVESFLQHYVWRYTSKLDKKLDQITDALIKRIDEYLDGEIPQSFEIDFIQSDGPQLQDHVEPPIKQPQTHAEKAFISAKLYSQYPPRNADLIELEPPPNPQQTQQGQVIPQNVVQLLDLQAAREEPRMQEEGKTEEAAERMLQGGDVELGVKGGMIGSTETESL